MHIESVGLQPFGDMFDNLPKVLDDVTDPFMKLENGKKKQVGTFTKLLKQAQSQEYQQSVTRKYRSYHGLDQISAQIWALEYEPGFAATDEELKTLKEDKMVAAYASELIDSTSKAMRDVLKVNRAKRGRGEYRDTRTPIYYSQKMQIITNASMAIEQKIEKLETAIRARSSTHAAGAARN